jgi:hypothetical protein
MVDELRDDSTNIRCAFDLAKSSHANVELPAGNFTAAQVFVYDFRGSSLPAAARARIRSAVTPPAG